MKILKGKDFTLSNTCVTIGKFDGVHIGHRSILKELKRFKEEQGLNTVVLTFDFSFFSKNPEDRLNSYEEKIKILEALDIDIMIDYPFDEETKNLEAEDFVKQVLLKRLGAKAVIVGDNFRFGHKAGGDAALLKKMGEKFGFDAVIIPCVNFEGSAVSSTRIRDEKNEGHIEKVHLMLGE